MALEPPASVDAQSKQKSWEEEHQQEPLLAALSSCAERTAPTLPVVVPLPCCVQEGSDMFDQWDCLRDCLI